MVFSLQNRGRAWRSPFFLTPVILAVFFFAYFFLHKDKAERKKNISKAKQPEALAKTENKTHSEMAQIPAGCFDMGSENGSFNEKPAHKVCLDKFFMDKYEVTQAEYQKVAGKTPSYFKGCDNCPVENVAWKDAHNYCKEIGKRLPTEAEWEYAARAGAETGFYWASDTINDYAWSYQNSDEKTHPVGTKKPNKWGLYDISRNVWEWVNDWYDEEFYKRSPGKNPKGSAIGNFRVIRGGSWVDEHDLLRCAYRNERFPDSRLNYIGFRCAR